MSNVFVVVTNLGNKTEPLFSQIFSKRILRMHHKNARAFIFSHSTRYTNQYNLWRISGGWWGANYDFSQKHHLRSNDGHSVSLVWSPTAGRCCELNRIFSSLVFFALLPSCLIIYLVRHTILVRRHGAHNAESPHLGHCKTSAMYVLYFALDALYSLLSSVPHWFLVTFILFCITTVKKVLTKLRVG